MSNQLKMARIHTIEQLLAHGWSHRRIARELDIHRATVARYARRPPDPDSKPAISTAGSSELIEPPPDSKPAISTAGSGDVIDPPADPKPAITTAGVAGRKCECDPHRETIVAKLAIGLSAQRIHQDLVAEHGYTHSYESVKRFVRKLGASRPIPFRRMETLPGEEAQIDYGLGAFTIKPGSKKKKRPQLLRVVLSHSRKAYSEVMWCQDTESLIRGIENAFHHFGGVPKTLVPDNLKAAVLEARLVRSDDHAEVRGVRSALRRCRAADQAAHAAPQRQGRALRRLRSGQCSEGQAVRFACRAERAPARLGDESRGSAHPRHHEEAGARAVRSG
ncbi:MAG: DDE-type integrase/transposase/recombinase [Planctomycetes bacterium]|nr:DDE-type integrase/transposase/recombinase [Planctomycetota bacterium]